MAGGWHIHMHMRGALHVGFNFLISADGMVSVQMLNACIFPKCHVPSMDAKACGAAHSAETLNGQIE